VEPKNIAALSSPAAMIRVNFIGFVVVLFLYFHHLFQSAKIQLYFDMGEKRIFFRTGCRIPAERIEHCTKTIFYLTPLHNKKVAASLYRATKVKTTWN
jgi:hypothetical protein